MAYLTAHVIGSIPVDCEVNASEDASRFVFTQKRGLILSELVFAMGDRPGVSVEAVLAAVVHHLRSDFTRDFKKKEQTELLRRCSEALDAAKVYRRRLAADARAAEKNAQQIPDESLTGK